MLLGLEMYVEGRAAAYAVMPAGPSLCHGVFERKRGARAVGQMAATAGYVESDRRCLERGVVR